MNSGNISTLSAFGLFLIAGLARGAKAPADSAAALRLPDQRSAAPKERDRPTVHIIREDALKNLQSLEDALKKVPGFRIRKFAGLGGYAETMFRGSNGKQVQVTLDGVKLNTTAHQSVDLGKIPLWMIKEVHVDKSGMGPESLFENGVVSVHLYTRKKGRHTGNVQGRVGSFATRELSGLYKLGADKVSLQLQGGFQDAENDFRFPSDNGTQYNTQDDFTDSRKNNQYRNLYGDAMTDWYLADSAVLTAGIKYRNYRKNFCGPFTRDPKAYTDYRDILFHTALSMPLGTKTQSRLQAKVDGRNAVDNYVDPEHTMGTRSYELRRTGWSFSGQAALKGSVTHRIGFNLGLRTETEQVKDDDLHHFNRFYAPPNARLFSVTPALQAHWNPLDNVFLTGSLKYPWLWMESYRVESMVNSVSEYFETFFYKPVYQAHLKYLPFESHALFIKYARVRRFPAFIELLGNNNGIRKNPDLQPEFTRSFSAGWNWTGKHLSTELIGFRNRYQLPIRLVYQSPPDSRFENTRGYRSLGLEFSAGITFSYLECRNALSWSDAVIDDPQSNLEGNRPQFTHRLENYTEAGVRPFPFLRLGANMEYKGPYYFSDYNLDSQLMEGRTLFGASVDIAFSRAVFSFNAFNLGNRYYEDFRYNPNSGRSYNFTTELNF